MKQFIILSSTVTIKRYNAASANILRKQLNKAGIKFLEFV